MKSRLVLAVAITLFSSAALAGPPADAVEFFYRNIGAETEPGNRDRFTGAAKAYLDANDRVWAEREKARLDFGLAVDAQDFDEAEIAGTLELIEDKEGKEAFVTASFSLFGGPRSIEWTLIEEDGIWKIEDIASNTSGWRVSEFTCE